MVGLLNWSFLYDAFLHHNIIAGEEVDPHSPVGSKDLFKFADVVILIGVDQVGHCEDLGIAPVGLSLK